MTIPRPVVRLTVGGRALSGPQGGVREARVELGTGSAHDAFRIQVSPGSRALDAAPGDAAEVALGYGDSPDAVLTGVVTAVERSADGGALEGLAGTVSMSGARLGRSFVRLQIAKIVSELVDAAGATAGEIDAPAKVAAFHVDERRTLWSHVQVLAELSGSEVSAAADGGLNFRPVRTAAAVSHTLRHGADVVSWDVAHRSPETVAFTVMAPGAASEDGEEKWHLLTKEPEGASPSTAVRFTPALADRDAARSQEKALRAAAARAARRGHVVVVGDVGVRAGDVVEVKDLPGGAGGTFRVTRVTHRLAPATGFRTRLALEAAQ